MCPLKPFNIPLQLTSGYAVSQTSAVMLTFETLLISLIFSMDYRCDANARLD